MAVYIVTNNPDIPRGNYELEYREEQICVLLEYVKERIGTTHHFLADPLGGYAFRPNPYHTFFLEAGRQENEIQRLKEAEWVERLDKKCLQEEAQYRAYAQTEERRKDCRAIDASIALCTLRRLI